MRYLQRFWKFCVACTLLFRHGRGVDAEAGPLSRYLTSSRHYAAGENRVKWRAFLPRRGEASVYLTNGLPDHWIWRIGQVFVTQPSGKTLHGRGDLYLNAVNNTGLKLVSDGWPPRHANIVGWPAEKSAQMNRAQLLADEATLFLRGNRRSSRR